MDTMKDRSSILLTEVEDIKKRWQEYTEELYRKDLHDLWCWRRLLRVPWTARRSNQSILKEINPKYSLEGQMLKLKLQYFGYLMWRTDSLENWCWERLKAGGEGDDRGWDSWMASLTQWTWVWVSSRSWWWTGKPGVLQSHGVAKSWTWLSNWTELLEVGYSRGYLQDNGLYFNSSPSLFYTINSFQCLDFLQCKVGIIIIPVSWIYYEH